MVEQDAICHEHSVRLSVVHGIPVRRDLADGVRTARVKRRLLVLWWLGGPEHLGRSRLVKADRPFRALGVVSDCFE